jgi:hypothetical protein
VSMLLTIIGIQEEFKRSYKIEYYLKV